MRTGNTCFLSLVAATHPFINDVLLLDISELIHHVKLQPFVWNFFTPVPVYPVDVVFHKFLEYSLFEGSPDILDTGVLEGLLNLCLEDIQRSIRTCVQLFVQELDSPQCFDYVWTVVELSLDSDHQPFSRVSPTQSYEHVRKLHQINFAACGGQFIE